MSTGIKTKMFVQCQHFIAAIWGFSQCIKETECYTPTHREGAILQSPCLLFHPSVCLSVHTFVTDISASIGRNDCTSTSCLPCDLQMNEWGYSYHDVACNILLFFGKKEICQLSMLILPNEKTNYCGFFIHVTDVFIRQSTNKG